jgi:hypothetical protein
MPATTEKARRRAAETPISPPISPQEIINIQVSIALNDGARTVATEPCVLAKAIVRMQHPSIWLGKCSPRALPANTVG